MSAAIKNYRRLRMLVVALADVAALAEIVAAMYRATHTRGDLTSAFVPYFFTLFLPTLALTAAALLFLRLWYGKAIRAAARTASPMPDEGGLVV